MIKKKKDYFEHFCSPLNHTLPPTTFSSMRLQKRLKNKITLPLMCNTFQISPLLAERIETNCSLPPSPAHFLSLERWGYTIKKSCSRRRGAGRCRTPISFHSPFFFSLPDINSCHHHLSFVIKDRLSDSDGHLLLLMNTNMEGMIRRISTVTNFQYNVSCYQWVAANVDFLHAFIWEERQTHANLSSPLGIWYRCTIKAVLILVPDIHLCFIWFF